MECDRQGCLADASSGEQRVLEDGCIVQVCVSDLHHFREEGALRGVYFHPHSVAPSLEEMLLKGEWQTVAEALVDES